MSKQDNQEQTTAASNSGYADEASELLARYEEIDFEVIHADVSNFLPTEPSSIADIGSGSGRDAAWFAANGHTVIAVEPTIELRTGAAILHPAPAITWLDDKLPDLERLSALALTFDVVMINAVWMHLNPQQRRDGMQSVASLMHCGSRVFIRLRHGQVPTGRVMFDVSGTETSELGRSFGLETLYCATRKSVRPEYQRLGIHWTSLVLERA